MNARFGTLKNYDTGEDIRPATLTELVTSLLEAESDGGAGVFLDKEGTLVYVDGADQPGVDTVVRELRTGAAQHGDSDQVQCVRDNALAYGRQLKERDGINGDEVNWESELYCDECSCPIESAYEVSP
jgi:hypothetical protein